MRGLVPVQPVLKPERGNVEKTIVLGRPLSVALWLALGACAPKTPTTGTEQAPPRTAPSQQAGNAPEAPPVAHDPKQAPVKSPEPTYPSAAELCEELCKKVEQSCKPGEDRFCRAGCPDFEAAAERCPVEVEEALTCQTASDDFLVCSRVAATECGPLYRALTECREGRAEPKPRTPVAADDGPPEGWKQVAAPSLGGAFLMPDAPLATETQHQLLVVRSGYQFLVERMSEVPVAFDDKAVLRMATAYVGLACVKKLRLHGRYETGNLIHIRFHTVCDDQTAWAGIFHLLPSSGVAASVKGPAGAGTLPEDLDTFLFGFEVK